MATRITKVRYSNDRFLYSMRVRSGHGGAGSVDGAAYSDHIQDAEQGAQRSLCAGEVRYLISKAVFPYNIIGLFLTGTAATSFAPCAAAAQVRY